MGVVIENKKIIPKLFTCLSTGLKLDSKNLLKFVLAPDNSLTLDLMDNLQEELLDNCIPRSFRGLLQERFVFRDSIMSSHLRENFISYVETALVNNSIQQLGSADAPASLSGDLKSKNRIGKERSDFKIEALDGSKVKNEN